MIHAYSLVHDDMPCMDDDALRRGKPTVHVPTTKPPRCWSATLQAQAFELSAPLRPTGRATPVRARQLRMLPAGPGRRFGGHVRRPGHRPGQRGHDLTLAELEQMHRLKTGALLRAAVLWGAGRQDADRR
jgi:farnesyl diphosphate synthase